MTYVLIAMFAVDAWNDLKGLNVLGVEVLKEFKGRRL